MKVTVEDLSTVKKTLHIEIPLEEVTRELDDAYKSLKKSAKIKGFRPGKAPRSVLERLFKKDVHADVTQKLIQGSFVEALQETDLNPIGTPQIDPPEIKPDAAYLYDATVEIHPEIDTIDFKGLQLKKTRYTVGEGEIDAQLKRLQKNLAQRKPITEDRPAQDKDFVTIDYEGFKGDKPFDETQKTENFLMQIGRGTISETLDEKIIGMKAGEAGEVTVNFAADHPNPKLAGNEILFKIRLNEIREEVLPEIDDEFAKRLGAFETLEDLKKDISGRMAEGYEKRTEHELNEQIFTALIEKTDFEVPESLVDMEMEGIIREAERSFAMQGMSMESVGITRENLAQRHRGTAEKQVRRHMILNQIIKQENLALSDEDLEQGFADMAESARQPVEEIKKYYRENKDGLDFFKHTLLEKQAIRLILDQSSVEEVAPAAETEAAKND